MRVRLPGGVSLTDAATALSLANLCFIPLWSAILVPAAATDSVRGADCAVAIAAVLCLAALFTLAATAARRIGGPLAARVVGWAFVAVAVVCAWFAYNAACPDRPAFDVTARFSRGRICAGSLLLLHREAGGAEGGCDLRAGDQHAGHT